MRLLIAPASFKGSLSATKAAAAMAEGARRASAGKTSDLALDVVPLADGGEGTVEAVRRARGGALRTARVRDPLGRPVEASYLVLDDDAAVIEMAAASGLPLLASRERDPLRASTHGTGDLILAAVAAGARRVIIGVGGSATVDGGAGAVEALGARLLDQDGRSLPPGGGALGQVARIDLTGLAPVLQGVEIDVLCDVRNPLTGPRGAAHVFGPQKGATPETADVLDAGLRHFAAIATRGSAQGDPDEPGTGAAGGLAFGLSAVLGARLRPGIEVVMDLLGVPARIRSSDLVLSGEGTLDGQTSGGKVIAGLARVAMEAGVPLVAIAGRVTSDASDLYARGLTAAFSLADGPRSLDECERDAAEMLTRATENALRLWLAKGIRDTINRA